jgi:hypothetical protein
VSQPRQETRDCRIALFVAPTTLERIKRAAEANGLSRAEFLRQLLNWGWKLGQADEPTRALIADLLRDTDRSGEAGQTAKQAGPKARAGAEGIAQATAPYVQGR